MKLKTTAIFLLLLSVTGLNAKENINTVSRKTEAAPPRAASVNTNKPQKALFVFAHSDDEFGAIAVIQRLIDKDVQAWCVWTCNNSSLRKSESQKAMRLLGLKKSQMIFLNVNGLNNSKDLNNAVNKLATLIKQQQFHQIFMPAYEGGHVQHDKTNFITMQAAEKTNFKGILYEFPLYNYYGGKMNLFTFIPSKTPAIPITLTEEQLNKLESLVKIYESQKDITDFFLQNTTRQQRKTFTYRPAIKHTYTQKPHKGKLWYELPLKKGKGNFKLHFKRIVCNYMMLE